MCMQAFTHALLAWYAQGHRDLPWRKTRDAYRIWISEIMLQQTRAETVVSYYERFLAAFPDLRALAQADEQAVLKLWEGLGYYSRARNLQATARIVLEKYAGELPHTARELVRLPGIGPYTAGAVAAIAYGEAVAAVDGNVERVLARYFGIRHDVTHTAVKREIVGLCQKLVPAGGDAPGLFANAMMELGATVCTPKKAACLICPLRDTCDACRVGDAQELPIKQKAKAQRVEKRDVIILISGECVLVRKRTEKLLNGLWVFPDFAGQALPTQLAHMLEAYLGANVVYDEALGHARHVFTHVIWEMELHAFYTEEQRNIQGAMWVNARALLALPMPTAVKAARQAALKKLNAALQMEATPDQGV